METNVDTEYDESSSSDTTLTDVRDDRSPLKRIRRPLDRYG